MANATSWEIKSTNSLDRCTFGNVNVSIVLSNYIVTITVTIGFLSFRVTVLPDTMSGQRRVNNDIYSTDNIIALLFPLTM